jgi:hypothetical protein
MRLLGFIITPFLKKTLFAGMTSRFWAVDDMLLWGLI